LLNRIKENGWYISVGPIAIRSKTHKKIIRDMPIQRILLETDSPWFGSEGNRNIPISVLDVVKRISQVKKIDMKEVDKITTQNAIKFYGLTI
jgi:TatD DNase family protein